MQVSRPIFEQMFILILFPLAWVLCHRKTPFHSMLATDRTRWSSPKHLEYTSPSSASYSFPISVKALTVKREFNKTTGELGDKELKIMVYSATLTLSKT